MSAVTLGQYIAIKSVRVPRAGAHSGTGGPSAETLLKTIGGYIPTEVTTGYVALAGGIATLPAPGMPWTGKLTVAIIGAVVAAFVTWVIGHRAAQARAKATGQPAPLAKETLAAGWYEIGSAAIALFVWATAMPESWFDWGRYVAFAPTGLVLVASFLLGGLAVLLNRNAVP